MLHAMPKAATRVRRPRISPMPPKNSAAMARKAKGAGLCIMSVKKCIVPESPYPPNQPSIFCEPWAKKTTPSMSRRMVRAPSFVVDINFLNMVCSPWMLEFRWPQAGPCGRGGCGDRDYTQDGQVGGGFLANGNERLLSGVLPGSAGCTQALLRIGRSFGWIE